MSQRLYMTASGVETKDKKIQSCTLLHVIGDEALEGRCNMCVCLTCEGAVGKGSKERGAE